MSNPTVSVVMSAYNADRFIKEAIESILSQTFEDFEFIIIDDGSTDDTRKIIESFNDKRIILLKNEGNQGLSYSFNKGINLSKGKYIARMDADDISLPDRFAKQVSFLDSHPKEGILGSSMLQISEHGVEGCLFKREPSHPAIKWASLFSTPMYHPTIMARSEILKNHHYNEGLNNSEDYELWSRLLFTTHTIFANIKRPLLLYRTYPTSFTQTINLDKRAVSAHNTIKNISYYKDLSEENSKILIRLRQEQKLPLTKLIRIWFLYFKLANVFRRKENLDIKFSLIIYKKLADFSVFLTKHYIKHIKT